MRAEQFDWQAVDPAQVGMDSAKLARAHEVLVERGTRGLLVLRNDRVVLEWYEEGLGPDTRFGTASLVKGMFGGTALVAAIDDGFIQLDDPACKYIGAWRDDPIKSKITIRHLVTHSSGMSNADHVEEGWMGAFWRRDPDPFSISIHEAPILYEPGSVFIYSNPGYAALAYAITASLQGSPYRDLEEYYRDRIMRRIGIADDAWGVGYGTKYMVDGLPLVATWGGGVFTARATVAVGRLTTRRGNWDGQQIISEACAKMAVTNAGGPLTGPNRPDASRLSVQAIGWANNSNGSRDPLPRDAFFGDGGSHNFLFCVPSLNLIVARYGNALGPGSFGPMQQYIINPILAAINE